MLVAAKILAAVEVNASRSNQHEFNAGALRKALELPERVDGSLDMTYLPRTALEEPTGERFAYTLYNAREGKPRSAEYRLYFKSSELQETVAPGDILILARGSGDDLCGLTVPSRSELGRVLGDALAEGETELEERFRRITAIISNSSAGQLLAATREPDIPDSEALFRFADESFLERAVRADALPTTARMAAEAAAIVHRAAPTLTDPDTILFLMLEAETAVFRRLEENLGQRALDRLTSNGKLSFADATAIVMERLQARRSRRGHSLQNHFANLLRARKIRFSAQAATERGETPDFLFPGFAEYRDSSFPSGRLRMVACKSTLKERWGQILKEADRIREKYVLTLDERVSDDVIRRTSKANLRLFLPSPVLKRGYSARSTFTLLSDVKTLLEKVSAT